MRRLLVISILLLFALGFGPSAASAQISADEEPPDFPDISEIVATINATGRYVDPAAVGDDSDVDAAITRANAAGIAVMLADPALNLEVITPLVDEEMRATGSDYTGILSLTPMQIAAEVAVLSSLELNEAFDAFEEGFVTGGDAGAIDAFVDSATGADGITSGGLDSSTVGDPVTDDGAGTATPESGTPGSDSSGGFPWFWSIVAAVAGFFGIRYFSNKRKREAAERAAIEVDRHEIAEQLRNNADRVIDLGDPVIATGDASLISLYEVASTTYQEVSLALPKASTAAEIDALDDRIDEAEWQFEVITARLAGEPEPPSPAERERAAAPPAPTGPALGADESVFDDSRRNPTSTSAPRPRSQPSSSRSGGGLGGGLGGMLGGVLGQILLGGGRAPQTSRRTQRRTASSGSWGSSPGRSMNDPFSQTRRSAPRRTSTRRAGGSRTRSSSRRTGGSRSRGGGSRRR